MEPNTTDIILYVRIKGEPHQRAISLVALLDAVMKEGFEVDWEPVSS